MRRTGLRRKRPSLVWIMQYVCFLLCLCSATTTSFAAEDAIQKTQDAPAPIKLEDVAKQIIKTSDFVRTLSDQLVPVNEIIIPHSQLISDQVTNWTLSDRHRRIDLQVGVDYASSPQKVIELLSAAAALQPNILKYPSPRAVLTGFGDSSINYELRAWTNETEHWVRPKSELAVAVYDAIQNAGMSIPPAYH